AARERLRAHTAEALERGVFGVPTCEVDGRLFWGFDALPMLRQQLAGVAPLPDALWDAAEGWPVGVQRTQRS
ncbi:DsbA family protein, partial [Tibeticola sp.]|uniref:DsbA family protein n=1 Tax=Tibeticola sp. TaxID=2005368 RepID=UPI002583E21F